MNGSLDRIISKQTAGRYFARVCHVVEEQGGVTITKRGKPAYLILRYDAVNDLGALSEEIEKEMTRKPRKGSEVKYDFEALSDLGEIVK